MNALARNYLEVYDGPPLMIVRMSCFFAFTLGIYTHFIFIHQDL